MAKLPDNVRISIVTGQPDQAHVERCPACGLHPYDFDVDEYKQELDRVDARLRQVEQVVELARPIIERLRDGLTAVANPGAPGVTELVEALAAYDAAKEQG